MKLLPLAAALLTSLMPMIHADDQPAAAAVTQSAPLPLAERIKWFEDARFGMFIHWGLYAVAEGEWQGKPVDGIGEWIMHNGKIPATDYEKLAAQFNPEKFDAAAWTELMKEAGVKYFVLTTKHHDGFGLFRSKMGDYNIAATPWGKAHPDTDILAELSREARKRGITVGWYHSILDWHHPDYGQRSPWSDWSKAGPADMEKYEKYLHGQVAEVLSNYGPVHEIWFDGEWDACWTHERGVKLYEHCLKSAPAVLVNNRVDKGRAGMAGMTIDSKFKGDFGTPEQEIPEHGFPPGVFWESCMTMNDTWGWKKNDHAWKSATTLVRNLINTSSKGGNYLLNVGPKPDGTIPSESAALLKEMGAWLKVNGEAIYSTKAGLVGGAWGKSTLRQLDGGGVRLYLHVFDWPKNGKFQLAEVQGEPKAARILGSDATLTASTSEDGLSLSGLPAAALNPHATVIALDFAAMPKISASAVRAQADGSYLLTASLAILTHGLRAETKGEENIGFWTNKEGGATWTVKAASAGKFKVSVALANPADGAKLTLCNGDTCQLLSVPATGAWDKYQEVVCEVELKAGLNTLELHAVAASPQGIANVRPLKLTPIK